MRNMLWTRISVIPLLLALFLLNACAAVKLKTIPTPPPSAKLRVYAIAISNKPESRWPYAFPHQQFENYMYKQAGSYLKGTGIYDFVPRQAIETVLGDQMPGDEAYWWFRNDYALLKEVGKGVHADYAMIVARSISQNETYKLTLVNLETGAQYSASEILVLRGDGLEANARRGVNLLQSLYRKLFYVAKGDLLATAVRKGRAMSKEDIKKPEAPDTKLALAPPPAPQVVPPPPAGLSVQDRRRDFEEKLEQEMADEQPATDKTKLVVYDLNAAEQLNVVSLILSEALREELFMLGQYLLVNRENLQQVMQELNLQQSGLVDEKQIVKLGKWLAANEAVTGRLAALGNSYVLQAKRTDIQTMSTLGLGSLRCTAGHEEELLKGMPGLARKLAGLKSEQQ